MDIKAPNPFSYAGFAATILRVMGTFAVLFTALILFGIPYASDVMGMEINANINYTLFVPAFIYLSTIFGWSVAYSKFFRFPANQRVLLSGVGIAALTMLVSGGIAQMLLGEMTFLDWLAVLPQGLAGYLLGAAMQLYFMVVVLRYVFRMKLPF